MALLTVAPSTIVARLAAGDLTDATPAEILTLLGLSTGVSGPGSSTDNALARFDALTGQLIQDSVAILTDAGALSGITTLNMSGALTVGGLVDGRDLGVDGAKLDLIEALADVTDETNVLTSLDGATITAATVAIGDKVLIQDADDSDNIKTVTSKSIADLASGGGSNPNAIINGNFNIWQRGITFAAVADDQYTADRWVYGTAGAGVVTITQDTSVPDIKSESSLKIDVTTLDGTLAATDRYHVGQKIQGFTTIGMGLGQAGADSITVSFWVSSPKTGIHSLYFQNSAQNRSYVAEYTVAVADTWEFFTVTIVGDLTGTWLKGNDIGLEVGFALAAGADFDTTAGSWQAGDFIASTNQVNCMDSAANNFLLSQVKVEIGIVPTDFLPSLFSQEIAACKPFYQKTFPYAVTPATGTGQEGSLSYRVILPGISNHQYESNLPVQMRTDPTVGGGVVFYNPVNANTNWYSYSTTADSGVSAASLASNEQRIYVANPQVAGDLVSHFLAIHFTAEAEF